MHPRNASTASQQLMPQSPSGISLNLTSIFDQRQMAAWPDRTNPTTSGSGTVPVEFQYSNAVNGPEGPIATPDPPLLS
jgi:hypothetical protein